MTPWNTWQFTNYLSNIPLDYLLSLWACIPAGSFTRDRPFQQKYSSEQGTRFILSNAPLVLMVKIKPRKSEFKTLLDESKN